MQLVFYITLFMNCYIVGLLAATDFDKRNAAEMYRDVLAVSVMNVFASGAFLMFGQW